MLGILLLASSLLSAPSLAEADATLRPIRNEKCEASMDAARGALEARLADSTALCGKGNVTRQVGGWSCKHLGCAKDQYRCVTQYACAEGTLTLSVPGKPGPSSTPSVDALATSPLIEPSTKPNAKIQDIGAPQVAATVRPGAERRDIPNGKQVFTEEKGIDENGTPSAKLYDRAKGSPNDLKVYGHEQPSATATPASTSSPMQTLVDKMAEDATSLVPPAIQKQNEALKEFEKE